ncbi:hypothetical protein [Thalassobacillus pellis]|uniref:hypothetical protein n=1 Tax=Thalassobacillus pellis TaxID=748008 RepID=UPI00195F7024|nr:hypothetical protein [Thalassobacillus pellis]MBM7554725.1 hypothetical protein [Thalassobacillus pellis]
MGEILELIFGNIVIIAAIIGGIISWVSRSMGEKKEQSKPYPPSNNAPRQAEGQQNNEMMEEKAEEQAKRYYDQKERHIRDIAERSIGDPTDGYAQKQTKEMDPQYSNTEEMKRFIPGKSLNSAPPSLSIGKNLTRKKVAESMVMAEILGPPRSKKPHRSFSSRNN